MSINKGSNPPNEHLRTIATLIMAATIAITNERTTRTRTRTASSGFLTPTSLMSINKGSNPPNEHLRTIATLIMAATMATYMARSERSSERATDMKHRDKASQRAGGSAGHTLCSTRLVSTPHTCTIIYLHSLAFFRVGRRSFHRHHTCAPPGSPLLIDYDKRVADS
jgi:hypothetical protein